MTQLAHCNVVKGRSSSLDARRIVEPYGRKFCWNMAYFSKAGYIVQTAWQNLTGAGYSFYRNTQKFIHFCHGLHRHKNFLSGGLGEMLLHFTKEETRIEKIAPRKRSIIKALKLDRSKFACIENMQQITLLNAWFCRKKPIIHANRPF